MAQILKFPERDLLTAIKKSAYDSIFEATSDQKFAIKAADRIAATYEIISDVVAVPVPSLSSNIKPVEDEFLAYAEILGRMVRSELIGRFMGALVSMECARWVDETHPTQRN